MTIYINYYYEKLLELFSRSSSTLKDLSNKYAYIYDNDFGLKNYKIFICLILDLHKQNYQVG